MNTDSADEPLLAADENTLARLAAIEDHLHQIETRLGAIREFNGRLDEIHTTLETVIGFATPDQANESLAPSTHVDDSTTRDARIVAHVGIIWPRPVDGDSL